MNLAGRRALVTGGASGIGRATAALLAQRGALVAVVDSADSSLLAAAADAINAAVAVTADVRDADAVDAAIFRASEALGAPADLIVNAAGVYRITPLLDLSPAAWDDLLATNLRGTWLVAAAAVRLLRAEDQSGSIVNIASTAALIADQHEPTGHYNASKAGVVALTRQMAAEWAPLGIRANCVLPGVIDTPMLRLTDDTRAARGYLDSRVPLRRLGRADEVARAIVFLASDEASYVTGAALVVDGGATAV